MATILDPRYKIEMLEYYFPLIYGDKAKNEMICDYTSGRIGREGTRGTCVGEDPQVDDSLMDFERYHCKNKGWEY